jgi:hypothetical protein
MKKTVDLSTLDTTTACNSGAQIELRHPATNVPLGIFIGVLGRDSDVFKEYIRTSINSQLRKEAMAKKRGRDVDVATMEQREVESIELLVTCTTGWNSGDDNPTITMEGEALPFNISNAKRVYTKMSWIRDQVNQGIGDLENFLKI